MTSLEDLLDSVHDEESFSRFVDALKNDRRCAKSLPITADGHQGEWANQSIEAYLEAANAWFADSRFGSRPGPKPSNPWRLFAQFLLAGKAYE
jgi:hypothetical protein